MKKITLMQCDLPRYLLSTVSCLKVGWRMFERILRTSGEGALGLDSQLLVLQPLVFREASRLEGRMDSIAWEVNRQSCSHEEGGGCVGSSVPCGPVVSSVSWALRAGMCWFGASLFFGWVTVGIPQGLLEWGHWCLASCLGPMSGSQGTPPLGSH